MATHLGVHADRLAGVRALQTVKGRRTQRHFAFEGPTLLQEAHATGFPIEEIYATQAAYEATPLVRELDAGGTPVYVVDEASAAKISDLRTPSGLVAVAPIQLGDLRRIFARGTLFLVLADLNDPANAGTLLRSAEAFGCAGAVFGRLGIDPYHPKVVRGAMGASFRLPLAVAEPTDVAAESAAAGVALQGLAANGACLGDAQWGRSVALVVGNERHGLGAWEAICQRILCIPMRGPTESLSAAVAGSIALYEASRTQNAPCQ